MSSQYSYYKAFISHKNLRSPMQVLFTKLSNCDCCFFCRFEIQTLTPNRFKNETNDTLTLLAHNYNHQLGFLKQKIVAPHRCGFNLKFPKHFY